MSKATTTTWYEVIRYSCVIKQVEVKSESRSRVILANGDRRNKDSDWSSYFQTHAEAIEHAREMLTARLHNARCSVAELETKLAALPTKASEPR